MITFDEAKRQAKLDKHGLDLANVESAFDAPMLTVEDDRMAYGEQGFKSACLLDGRVVILVWSERVTGAHVISCRYGNKHETDDYFQAFL